MLETTSHTPTGTVAILDVLAMGDGNRGHELGKDAPHLLLRRATCVEGEVELHLEFAPRPEYGLVYPLLDAVDGGGAAFGGADVLVLSSPFPLTLDQSSASAQYSSAVAKAPASRCITTPGPRRTRPGCGASPRSSHA